MNSILTQQQIESIQSGDQGQTNGNKKQIMLSAKIN
jgi:hypothetical protein